MLKDFTDIFGLYYDSVLFVMLQKDVRIINLEIQLYDILSFLIDF